MKPYLLVYNLGCALGWAWVLALLVRSVLAGDQPAQSWAQVELPLKLVQTAAVLEVLHSLLRLVSSPVATTGLQVGSRLFVLWGITNLSEEAQNHWSLVTLVGSWALAEIPRYLFYAVNLYTAKVPGILFYLRYNSFWLLYPTGQTSEMAQIWTALPKLAPVVPLAYSLWCRLALFLYLPLGPFMIFFMNMQRKRAMQKRKQAAAAALAEKAGPQPKKPLAGIQWPVTDEASQERSTSITGKQVIADSLAAVSQEASDLCGRERNWRFGYKKHVINTVRFGLDTPDSALAIATRGLKFLYQTMEFHRDGRVMNMEQAYQELRASAFETFEVVGEGQVSRELTVPYKKQKLSGAELRKQLDKWSQYGTIEPDTAEALRKLADNNEWLDLSDKYFCLLGATSAMGPLLFLLEHGANILAVDLDRPQIWEKLVSECRKSGGKLLVPVRREKAGELRGLQGEDYLRKLTQVAGGNLFTDAPELGTWALENARRLNVDLAVGGYAYLDGELHVRVALAMDMVMRRLVEERAGTSLGFLCSPTDVFVVPGAAYAAQQKNWAASKWWLKALRAVIGGRRMLVKNAQSGLKEGEFRMCDGLLVDQGPNYALAKRLQHWRAMLSRAAGHTVSTNIAPSTATASVLSNFSFKLAFLGMHHFKPMEVFYQETSNAVMGSLLLHDLQNPESAANANTKLANPLELFAHTAWHGGIWRDAYRMDSKGEVAVLAGIVGNYSPAVVSVLAVVGAWIKFIAGL